MNFQTSDHTFTLTRTQGGDAAIHAAATTELDPDGDTTARTMSLNSQSEVQECRKAEHAATHKSQDFELQPVKYKTSALTSFSISSILHGDSLSGSTTSEVDSIILRTADVEQKTIGQACCDEERSAGNLSERVELDPLYVGQQETDIASVCIQDSMNRSESYALPAHKTGGSEDVSDDIPRACLPQTDQSGEQFETDGGVLVHNMSAPGNKPPQSSDCVANDNEIQGTMAKQSTTVELSSDNPDLSGEEKHSQGNMIRSSSETLPHTTYRVTSYLASSVLGVKTPNSLIVKHGNKVTEKVVPEPTVGNQTTVGLASEKNCENYMSQGRDDNSMLAREFQSAHVADILHSLEQLDSEPVPSMSVSNPQKEPAMTVSFDGQDFGNENHARINTNTASTTEITHPQNDSPDTSMEPGPSTQADCSSEISQAVAQSPTLNNVTEASSDAPSPTASASDIHVLDIKLEPEDTGYNHALTGSKPRLHRADIAKTANRQGNTAKTASRQGATTTVIQRGKKKIRVTVIRGEWRTPKHGQSMSKTGNRNERSVHGGDRATRQDQRQSRVGLDTVVKTEPQEEPEKEIAVPRPASKLASSKKSTSKEKPAATQSSAVFKLVSSRQRPKAKSSSDKAVSEVLSSYSHPEPPDTSQDTSSAIPTALFRNAHIMVKAEPVDDSYADAMLRTSRTRGAGHGSRGRGRGRGRGRPVLSDRLQTVADDEEEMPEVAKIRYCSVQLKQLPPDIAEAGGVNLKTDPQILQDAAKLTTAICLEKRPRDTKRPWVCEQCGKSYKTKTARTQHYKVHVGIREHVCSICGAAFVYKSTLTAHIRFVHCGERPHMCKVCGKTFAWSSHLDVHMNRHYEDRPNTCPICYQKFSKFYIKKHLETHSDKRPFSCDLCGKKFKNKKSVELHERTHSGYKPYTCDECSKKFPYSCSLLLHKRTHTGDRPYRCKLCPSAFTQSTHLRTHLMGVHKIKNPPRYKGRTLTVERVVAKASNSAKEDDILLMRKAMGKALVKAKSTSDGKAAKSVPGRGNGRKKNCSAKGQKAAEKGSSRLTGQPTSKNQRKRHHGTRICAVRRRKNIRVRGSASEEDSVTTEHERDCNFEDLGKAGGRKKQKNKEKKRKRLEEESEEEEMIHGISEDEQDSRAASSAQENTSVVVKLDFGKGQKRSRK